jgi:hypothetical protein
MVVPRVFSHVDDGKHYITLQWQNENCEGVAIVFVAGDDEASWGVSGNGSQYADGDRAFKLSDGMPAELAERIRAVSSA